MRAKRSWALGAVAVGGVGLALAGGWWKMSQSVPATEVVASAPPAPIASSPIEPAPRAPEPAPAPVPEPVAAVPAPSLPDAPATEPVNGEPESSSALDSLASIAPLEAPVGEMDQASSAQDAPEVVFPSPQAISPAPAVEEPIYAGEDGHVSVPSEESAFAPVASSGLLTDVIAPDAGRAERTSAELSQPDPAQERKAQAEAQLEDFVRVSLAVFARNDTYNAAILRAEEQGEQERAQALRAEMASEARVLIEREFPWGFDRYIELARQVRADPELEEQAAELMAR